MKKLRITVNNKVYDVVVEVLEDDEQHVPGALPYPGATNGALRAGQGEKANAPPGNGVKASPGNGNGAGHHQDVIASPIAGTVQKVFVQAGGTIEAKAPVVMLDAMKMDTYIYAPRSGGIAEVKVRQGDAVQVGEPLIRYEPEA